MGALLALLVVAAVAGNDAAAAAAATGLLPGDAYASTALGKTLYQQVLTKLNRRHAAISALGEVPAGWRQRQSEVKELLAHVFAPLPDPSRPRPPRSLRRGVVHGGHGRSAATGTVERLLIETRPGYWAPAALWLPANTTTPVPAVLFPSGHSDTSFREDGAQLIAHNLALRGFAVLGYDPVGQGERRMTADLDGTGGAAANGTEHYSPSFEHEYLHRQATLLGVNAVSPAPSAAAAARATARAAARAPASPSAGE